jgi:hypothetical protein
VVESRSKTEKTIEGLKQAIRDRIADKKSARAEKLSDELRKVTTAFRTNAHRTVLAL